MSSCAQNEFDEQIQVSNVEDVQMKELIQYVRDIKSEIPAPVNLETRGIWSSLRNWFKKIGSSDGGAYRWANDNGFNFGQRLEVAVTMSLVSAINNDNARVQWKIDGEWKVYPSSLRDYKEIGNAHNRAIYELCRENPTLKYGSGISNSSLLSLVEIKTKALGYDGLSLLQRSQVMLMMDEMRNASTMSDVTNLFSSNFSNSRLDYQFLEEYLDAVTLLENKEEAISFTEQIYVKIDSMPNIQKSSLKCMVSIALCSINLWIPIQ